MGGWGGEAGEGGARVVREGELGWGELGKVYEELAGKEWEEGDGGGGVLSGSLR